jgi:hypothetical protein
MSFYVKRWHIAALSIVAVAAMVYALFVSRLAHAASLWDERVVKAAILHLASSSNVPVSGQRAAALARWFVKYGSAWRVDPLLAASVALQESHFRDRPSRCYVTKCRTKIDSKTGSAVEVCKRVWPGERGMLQIIPRYARASFTACKGRSWRDPDELYDTETNICVGMHLMAKRRRAVRKRRLFVARGHKHRWRRHFKPCSYRQRRFCNNGNRRLCAKHWWIASWNWGSHRVYCRRVSKFDHAGYPIRVLRRYARLVRKFRRKKA